MARDYSELHIDIMASVANSPDGSNALSPTTPATFESLISPPSSSRSSRVKSKGKKFSFRRMFSRKHGPTPNASNPSEPLSPQSQEAMSPTSDNSLTPMSMPPSSPFAAAGPQLSSQPSNIGAKNNSVN